MNIPDGLKYTTDHEWIRIDGSTGIVGVTDYAQSELGDIVYVDITAKDSVAKGATFGTIEAVKTVADLFAPAAGKILGVNEILKGAPETINKDPYGDGWILKIQLSNPADVAGLLDAAAYTKLVGAGH